LIPFIKRNLLYLLSYASILLEQEYEALEYEKYNEDED
jgi:hypothetical protein